MDNCGGYEEFAFVADFYDHLPSHKTRRDIDFYKGVARECDGPILEVACGTGRLLMPIARAGKQITGIDLSEPMLACCREHLDDEAENIRERIDLHKMDMRDFDLGRKYQMVIVAFRSFLHLLTPQEQLSCLQAINRHLEPGGQLLMDFFNPSLELLVNGTGPENSIDETAFGIPDGRKAYRKILVHEVDRVNQTIACSQIYNIIMPDGETRKQEHKFKLHYIFRYEAEHLLERCGFSVNKIYGDFEGHTFSEKSNKELIISARKR